MVVVEYLANAGFLIEGGGYRILVDALHSENVFPFSRIPDQILRDILEAGNHFSHLDWMLFTHCHKDHCNPELLRAMQDGNTRISLPEDDHFPQWLIQNKRAVLLTQNRETIVSEEDLRITAAKTIHDYTSSFDDTAHYSYFLEFLSERKNLVILGDAFTGKEPFAQWLNGKQVDAATVNFVEIKQEKGRRFLKEILNPGIVLLCHLPLPEDDCFHYQRTIQKTLSRVKNEIPPVRLCLETGCKFYIE